MVTSKSLQKYFLRRSAATSTTMFPEILLLTVFLGSAAYIQGTDIFLSPQFVDEWENTDVTLTCSYNGNYKVSIHWILNSHSQNKSAEMIYKNKTCDVSTGWLSDGSKYLYNCDGNLFNLTLTNISQQRHGESWRCIYDTGTVKIASNTVDINVKVPVQMSTLNPNNSTYTASENSTITWQCATTQCRPQPYFKWYLDNGLSTDESVVIMAIGENSNISSDTISNYNITYNLKLNRTWNGRYLFCGASNRNDEVILSQKTLLNITYPPDRPPRIGQQANGSEINVIKGRLVTLNCTATGGNPLPRLEWCRNNTCNQRRQTVSGSVVTESISWQPADYIEEDLTCLSIHQHNIDSIYVTVNVLYPPENVVINLRKQSGTFVHVMNSVSVIEGLPLFLNCSGQSKPAVSVYEWSGLILGDRSVVHIPDGIRRTQTKTLTCKVYNVMTLREPPLTVYGHNSSSLNIDVLYPPKVYPLPNMILVEGEDLAYSCNAIPGNPGISTFIWNWGSKNWGTQQLSLKNVSRSQSGTYTCIVSNRMLPSDGDASYGTDFGQFNLTVQYKAKVLRFFVNEEIEEHNLVVNENESISLTCEIEGDPFATGELILQRDIHRLNMENVELPISSTSQISTNLRLTTSFQTKCTDNGIHKCKGSNKLFNGMLSTTNKGISLHVKCKPRKSPFVAIPDTVESPTSVDVTLGFTALAYPVPLISGYVWTKKVETTDTWTNITVSGYRTIISTVGLQSNLTIKDVSQFDYGLYKITIDNGLGQFSHTFTLVPAVLKNDVTTAPPTNASIVVQVAASAAGGVVVLVAMICIVILCRKRQALANKEQTISSQHSNCNDPKDGFTNNRDGYSTISIIPDKSSNVYEGLQNTGYDQPYKKLSTSKIRNDGKCKTYENLQLTRIIEKHAKQKNSWELHQRSRRVDGP